MRKTSALKLPEGFRWISKRDIRKAFSTGEPHMDRYTLAHYFRWSKQHDSYVVIREIGGMIVAVMHFTVHHTYVVLEMLARNKAYGHPGAAGDLVRLLEWRLAPLFGVQEIRMEAMAQVVRYYDDVLGYVHYGEPFEDSDWGVLTPKKKRLAP